MALGVLPVGTANVWAKEIGLQKIGPALDALAAGNTMRMGLGRAGDRHFILASGVGFDGLVAQRTTRALLRRGKLAFVTMALRLVWGYRSTLADPSTDGCSSSHQVLWILVGNIQLYARVLRIAHKAKIDDGLIDVLIFPGLSPPHSLYWVGYVLGWTQDRCHRVIYRQCQTLEVRSATPLSIHVDAEVFGSTP